MRSSISPYSGSPDTKLCMGTAARRARAYRFSFRLLFVGRRIRFRSRRGRGGLSRGWGTSKLGRDRTVSGPNFGTLDCSYQLAAHWGRRLNLFQRLAALGLSQGISRKPNDSGKDQESPHRRFVFAFSPGLDQAPAGLRARDVLLQEFETGRRAASPRAGRPVVRDMR
jgi:hypothetical protein